MNPNCQGTRIGPPPPVDLRIPTIILGRKELMIAAAGNILSLRGRSAHSAKYTEEGDMSRTGPLLRGNIPALHALGSSDSDEEAVNKENRRKKTRKLVKAHLLNEATLGELEFGVELTKDQLSQVKQMLMSHSRCFALTLNDVGRTTIIEHHIRLKPNARPVYRPGFKRFSQHELQFIEKEVQKQLAAGIIRERMGRGAHP